MKYEMTDDQYATLLKACEPVPLIMLQCGMPRSQRENINSAWQALAKELGFKWDTVSAYPGHGPKVFSAEPELKP